MPPTIVPDLWTLLGSGLVLLAAATRRARLTKRLADRRGQAPPT